MDSPKYRGLRTERYTYARSIHGPLCAVKDDFLPAADYVRRAGVGHYREVTMPAGRTRSPWGDWESTLK